MTSLAPYFRGERGSEDGRHSAGGSGDAQLIGRAWFCARFFAGASVILTACVGQGESPASRPKAYPVVWDTTFHLASVSDVPRRLATATPDSADQVRFDNRCVPTAMDPGSSTCVNVDTVVTNTCDDFFRRHEAGYGATATINVQPLASVGARCTAIRAIGRARPARWSAVRDFTLVPAAIDSLPPVLGLNAIREPQERARRDAERGIPWSRSNPNGLTATMSDDPSWAGALLAQTEYEEDYVQVLARGDFDGDGWDDLLVQSIAGARGGSLVETQIFLLTRRVPGTQLRVVRELW